MRRHDQSCRSAQLTDCIAANHKIFRRSQAIGIGGNFFQAIRCEHCCKSLACTVGWSAFAGNQLHQTDVCFLIQRLQISDLERLDEHRVILAAIAILFQQFEQRFVMTQPQSLEIAGMFGFRIDANPLASFRRVRVEEFQHLFKGRYFKLAIILHIRSAQFGKPFLDPQCFQLGKREIFGEPAGHFLAVDDLAGLARRKIRPIRNIRGLANLVLVPGDQHTVLGQHQIGFDKIRALFDRQLIGGKRVLRSLSAGTAMGDDDGWFTRERRYIHARLSAWPCLHPASGQSQCADHEKGEPDAHRYASDISTRRRGAGNNDCPLPPPCRRFPRSPRHSILPEPLACPFPDAKTCGSNQCQRYPNPDSFGI